MADDSNRWHNPRYTSASPREERPAMPRRVPQYSFPPFSYVPGLFPRTSTREGSGFDLAALPPAMHDDWQGSDLFRFGIDLFNHGYYWEAHEAWEQVWHALGRAGGDADFVKGLIKLAAAGVKAREGRGAGVASHSRRAGELFTAAQASGSPRLETMPLARLLAYAAKIAAQPETYVNTSNDPVIGVFEELPLA
jgi:hypothetical protein